MPAPSSANDPLILLFGEHPAQAEPRTPPRRRAPVLWSSTNALRSALDRARAVSRRALAEEVTKRFVQNRTLSLTARNHPRSCSQTAPFPTRVNGQRGGLRLTAQTEPRRRLAEHPLAPPGPGTPSPAPSALSRQSRKRRRERFGIWDHVA